MIDAEYSPVRERREFVELLAWIEYLHESIDLEESVKFLELHSERLKEELARRSSQVSPGVVMDELTAEVGISLLKIRAYYRRR